MDTVMERRRLLELAVFGAGGLVAANSAQAQVPARMAVAGFPRQAWAHKDGVIKLRGPSDARTIKSPIDYLLVCESFGRYGIAYDETQFDVLRQLFTDDAVVELAKGDGKPFTTVSGLEPILANFRQALDFQTDQRRHCFSNVVVEHLGRREATALAYAIVTIASNGLTLGATVIYTANLRKDAGGRWQFSRLYIGMDDYAGPSPPKPPLPGKF
jgi:SnoaL-like domain